nr:MAG TPA: RNA polymerase Rpb2-like protein [Caudoviricetes sp.]
MFNDNNMFGEDSMDTLKTLSQNAPKAKHRGEISHIDLLYTGDVNVASDTVKELIERYDSLAKKDAKLLKHGGVENCRIDGNVRVDGTPLPKDHLALTFYIKRIDGMDQGDKVVFGSQLKSVVARMLSGVNETESGKPIDAIFGYLSISNRIVQSAELMGTTNVLLMEITKEVINMYRKERPRK